MHEHLHLCWQIIKLFGSNVMVSAHNPHGSLVVIDVFMCMQTLISNLDRSDSCSSSSLQGGPCSAEHRHTSEKAGLYGPVPAAAAGHQSQHRRGPNRAVRGEHTGPEPGGI